MQRDVEAYVSGVVRAGMAPMSAIGMALSLDDGVFTSALEKKFRLARLIRYPGRGQPIYQRIKMIPAHVNVEFIVITLFPFGNRAPKRY